MNRFIWFTSTAMLVACGGSENSSSSSSSGGGSLSSSSGSGYVIDNAQGYSALSDGKGGVWYEGVAITTPGFDKTVSLKAFEETLYPHLLQSGCGGCHNTQGLGQAPFHSDSNVELAHEYALTRVNFKDPVNSKFVVRMTLDRHNCPGTSCQKAGQEMLQAVNAWKDRVSSMLPETPRGIPANQNISDAQVGAWIETDKRGVASTDQPFMVYTSLHELHNEGLSADELNIVRAGLSKALNSVARWAPEIVNPVDVTGQGVLYKFDIRQYWGYNQGVSELFFGGSDDDLAFGSNKMDYRGNPVSEAVQRQKYNFTGQTVRDDAHALRIWQRVLHGNVEGAVENGTIPAYIDGFKAPKYTNAAGDYVKAEELRWVEAAQLIYTLTRPDVYNAIMMNPFYADEMESHLEVDISQGMDSFDYMITWDAITVDSRLLWRAKRKDGGWYWKTWDIFSGRLASGGDRSIFDVYGDADGQDIRFPWWANPIPKFVKWLSLEEDNTSYSFVASLNQTYGTEGGFGFAGGNTPGCENQPNYAVQDFGYCRHYTGLGGAMQSASEIIYDMPNGLQAYYLTGGFNQRRVDAFTNIVRDPRILTEAEDNIASATGYSYTNGPETGFFAEFARASDPRLNVGSSCIGCHADGMNRTSNDIRDWLDNNPSRLPKGPYGVDSWINDPEMVERVRELYPTKKEMNEQIEEDRKGFLASMGEIKAAMVLGEDKNVYVEPIIWTVEHVQRVKYRYPQTRSN